MGSRLDKNSSDVSKRIQNHAFSGEDGEEYEGSTFGGFSDYMRRKKIKLQNLDADIRSQSADKPTIFRGIVAHVNGYTQPSLSDLHTLIVSYGGGFLQYLDGKTACTHIIASQLTPKKKAEFAKYRIVKPAWIVDSVKAGKLLPWDNYRLVDEGVAQKVLGFENGNIVSQANRQQHGYRGQTDTSWYTSQVKSWTHEFGGRASADHDEHRAIQDEIDQPNERHTHVLSSATLEDNELIDDYNEQDASLIAPAYEPPNFEARDTGRQQQLSPSVMEATADTAPSPSRLSKTNTASASETAASLSERRMTAEEHNAILLQNPHMAKSSTANPDFLNQYYRESRLHHLSAWKAELKAQLQARTLEISASQKLRQKRPLGTRRYIMHVDFDSFFAAVSLRKHPHLINRPVVIAHGSGPGSEIASCNYPARHFGVKNGMWMKTALELCPNLKVLSYDFQAYEEASRQFYDSILDIGGMVQSISIDEALVDVSDQCIKAGGKDGKDVSEGAIYREQSKASELAQSLRAVVKSKTGCEVSVGIGGNILLAKVALRKAKPAGQHLIKPEDVLDFMGELKVTDLPGVAYSLGNKLEELGVKYVKDIRSLNKERLVTALGPKTGEKLWEYARGIDRAEVGDQVMRKSVSAEVNWGIRFITQQQAEDFVQCLCDELHKRLLENGVKGRQLTMKIMRKAADAGMDPPKNLGHGKCDTFNKSVVLGLSTNDKNVLGKEAISILRGYGFSPGELRGLGVQMQKLEPIKSPSSGTGSVLDSSQRKLQFKKPEAASPADRRQQSKSSAPTAPVSKASSVPADINEFVEEVSTLEQPKPGAMNLGAIEKLGTDGDKPLNIVGTQFMVPTQVDPTVLAELPADIRSKLAPKQRSILNQLSRAEPSIPVPKSRSASPYLSDSEFGLPNQSQLDPEALAALPEDMREELLAHYQNSNNASSLRRQNQQLLPQSPRKTKPMVTSKRTQLTPTKKTRNSSLFPKHRSKPKHSAIPTLTQSNFVSTANAGDCQSKYSAVPDGDVSKSFLEELPEDIRLEILTEQKRSRMQSKAGLDLGDSKKKFSQEKSDFLKGQQKLQVLGNANKPTFTSKRLSTLPELRDAMSAWVQEFSTAEEEGPFEEDAVALGQYLQKVVIDEGNMAKAVSVIEWLSYLVADWPFDQSVIRKAWFEIISLLEKMVQDSVAQRGLPPLALNPT